MKKIVTHLTKASISKSLLIISAVLLVGVGFADLLGYVKGTGIFLEFFGTCAGLYFGRQLNISKDDKQVKEEEI